jgi:hypothetical protein
MHAWENGYCESFNGKLRDECLNGEIFYSLREAQVIVEMWRTHYNTRRPHCSLGYRPPAPLAWVAAYRSASLRLENLPCSRTADGVQALAMNSLRSARTPVLAGAHNPQIQAKADSECRPDRVLRSELYSLSDWHKIPVSSQVMLPQRFRGKRTM